MTRTYGSVRAVDRVSLQIESGELFAMLGPSGSGKTTCLRLIAGFEAPEQGQILLDGRDVTSLPPYERDVNTVFQDYALFPHMSVLENVAYGLRVRRVATSEQRRRALEMLDLVKLADLAERRPSQLSGGQRQRVSLARALINQPRVLLLDEPLSALDLKLREEMQIELKSLQRRLGITFIFVTHDQGEALSMAHRVAVFNQGRIEQLDTPRLLYTRPRTPFVARFVGSANVIDNAFAVRAENVRVTDGAPPPDHVGKSGVLSDVQFLGATCRLHVQLEEGGQIAALSPDEGGYRVGQRVSAYWSPSDAVPLESPP